jgi:hypothetical protein
MLRHLTRSPFCLLLSGLLLMACGPISEEAPEALGVVESAMCSNSAVTALSISGMTTYQGEMAGSGTYAVSYPANAVWLEYRIDGVVQATEERLGASGTWYFSKAPVACGTRTFSVKAWPRVVSSDGSSTTCLSNASLTASKSVTEACPAVCGDGVCSSGEDEIKCARDCCQASICPDGKCCTTGRCSNGMACML